MDNAGDWIGPLHKDLMSFRSWSSDGASEASGGDAEESEERVENFGGEEHLD